MKAFRGILCAVLCLFLAACPPPGRNARKPAHVFLFIGDGMGYSSQILASRYLYGADDALAWEGFPFRAWMKTGNADMEEYDASLAGTEPWPLSPESPEALSYLLEAYTDSAASATAMACGVKTGNGLLGWKDGAAVRNLPEILSGEGEFAIGILSTVPFNHATPAAFMVHEPGRGDYLRIAEEVRLSRIPRVIVSGGHPLWCGTYLDQGELDSFLAAPEWTVAQRVAGSNADAILESAATLRPQGTSLLALFGGADGSLESPLPLDRPGNPALDRKVDEPSLAASVVMTARTLANESQPFFIMAEQGDIDWANHENDLPRMIGAVASLDEAVRLLLAFIGQEGDSVTEDNSLVIVTADHATGLPRYASSAGMEAGALPVRVGEAAPAVWDYPNGDRVEYRTTGHGNELVRCAVWPESAAAFFVPYLDGYECLDNTAIFRAILDFASIR